MMDEFPRLEDHRLLTVTQRYLCAFGTGVDRDAEFPPAPPNTTPNTTATQRNHTEPPRRHASPSGFPTGRWCNPSTFHCSLVLPPHRTNKLNVMVQQKTSVDHRSRSLENNAIISLRHSSGFPLSAFFFQPCAFERQSFNNLKRWMWMAPSWEITRSRFSRAASSSGYNRYSRYSPASLRTLQTHSSSASCDGGAALSIVNRLLVSITASCVSEQEAVHPVACPDLHRSPATRWDINSTNCTQRRGTAAVPSSCLSRISLCWNIPMMHENSAFSKTELGSP